MRRTFIFAGERYTDLLDEIEDTGGISQENKFVPYAVAYHNLRLPVHLLSCDDTGAMQLQIMSEPNYRTRLTRAVLKTHYQAPPEDVPAWDAIYGGRPFVLAVDMDLRRMDAAIQAARGTGTPAGGCGGAEGPGGRPCCSHATEGLSSFMLSLTTR